MIDFLTLPGFLISIAVVAVGITYIFSQIRSNDMKILRDSNEDLRKSLADNDAKTLKLETQVKELTSKVDILEKRNRTLEDLVVTALKQFFFENPKMAKDIATGAINLTGDQKGV